MLLAEQIESYFSILQREAMSPNDLESLPELARHLMVFGRHRHYQNRHRSVPVDLHPRQARRRHREDHQTPSPPARRSSRELRIASGRVD
jgi:hypothetical protein